MITIFYASIFLGGLSGLIFAMMDCLGKVDHRMKWKDLNWWQWACFIGVLQFPAFMFSMFLFFLLISQ